MFSHGHSTCGTQLAQLWHWRWHHQWHGHIGTGTGTGIGTGTTAGTGTGTGTGTILGTIWHHHEPCRLWHRRWSSNRGTLTTNGNWHWHATWHIWHWHWHWHLWHWHWALWHGHWHYDWHDWHIMARSPKTDRSGEPTGPRSRERSDFPRPVAKGKATRGQCSCKPQRRGDPPFPQHAYTSSLFALSVICAMGFLPLGRIELPDRA